MCIRDRGAKVPDETTQEVRPQGRVVEVPSFYCCEPIGKRNSRSPAVRPRGVRGVVRGGIRTLRPLPPDLARP
eukprot:2925865-Alexandrium_andersonii.AAC.1